MPSDRLRLIERAALALSCILGLAGSGWAFASRELTDFLGEGPVRVLSLSDAAQQTVIGVGLLLASVVWTVSGWSGLPLWRYALAGLAVLAAVALAPPLAVPMAALVALAAVAGWLRALGPERRAALAPARQPRRWVAGGALAAACLVVAGALSVWLLRPLVDEGDTLDEALAFELPAAMPAGVTPAAALSMPSTAAAGPAILATGELRGADSFHFGSGRVLLVRGPEGQILLRFEDYEVRNGPDLFVYLTPDPAGEPEAEGAVSLGRVRATKGNVNYEVPSGFDVSSFRSAVIWCRSFDVVFAVASFQ